ncbi:hypothetical protein AB0O28_02480 [Microbispora sp. NPDC088329]|uniref:hypothetical protein n=1 Tax=Microbispora sp. NPDC088329 TaxID=3154869 RepID=UPI00344A513B
MFDLAGAAPSNANAQPWHVEVVSGVARDNLAEALVSAGRAGRRTVDFPYSEDIYTPAHQRRRAAPPRSTPRSVSAATPTICVPPTTPRVSASMTRLTSRSCTRRTRATRD